MPTKTAEPACEKTSEINELIHAIMRERGGIPHKPEPLELTPENDEIRMAEAP